MNLNFLIGSVLTFILTACSAEAGDAKTHLNDSIAQLIPSTHVLSESIQGDLNGDKINDYVLIIKGTKKNAIIKNTSNEILDRNRRGIIILLSNNNGHQVSLRNTECFSSENEDGGVYYPPELLVEIKNGNLKINYLHGKYGYWSYTFRFQKSHFELIGFDSSENRGPVVLRTTSINFSTKKVQTKENVNQNSEKEGDERFKTIWKNFPSMKAIKLSEISDFDNLDVAELLQSIR